MQNLTNLPSKKPETEKEIIDYLTSHFRYYTMRSWNRSTSYAVDIKIHHLCMLAWGFGIQMIVI